MRAGNDQGFADRQQFLLLASHDYFSMHAALATVPWLIGRIPCLYQITPREPASVAGLEAGKVSLH